MKKIFLTMLAAGGIFTAATAQKLYTLQYCLEQGLQNNYSLRIAHNDKKVSDNNATWANAGMLPTLDFTAGYTGNVDNTQSTERSTGVKTKTNGGYDQDVNVGLNLNWTIFDGFDMTSNYKQLKILKQQGETNTRLAIEDMIANVASEYYNYVQQTIRLKNFLYAVSLSKERMRIVEARYHIGNFSRLDYQQSKVDFNADSAQYMKQQELVVTSRINLNELMAVQEVNRPLRLNDSIIIVNDALNYDELWSATLSTNAGLLRADQNTTIAQLDYRKVLSRNYPYVKLKAGYGYTLNKYETNATSRRSNWGLNGGITIGINLWDGNRRREKRNASLAIRNSQLEREQLELGLKADLSNLWQAYRNNLRLLNLERQNLVAARENHEIAKERYLLGDLSGIEMREAQKSLLDAEERILSAEYDTKICEISLLQISGKITKYLE